MGLINLFSVHQAGFHYTDVSRRTVKETYKIKTSVALNLRCVTFQKSEDLIYTFAEAWNHAKVMLLQDIYPENLLFDCYAEVKGPEKGEKATYNFKVFFFRFFYLTSFVTAQQNIVFIGPCLQLKNST